MEYYEKKYKDVLAKAREIHRNEDEKKFDMEWLFPELADSNDERIRKALLEMVHDTTGDELWVDYNVHKEEVLAWLEKQGESYTKKDVDDAYLKGICDAKHELEKQGEQKPTEWSKEDENRFQNIIACIEDCYNEKDAQDLIRWFKSLRHQPKPVWSKVDIKMLQLIIDGYQNTEDFSKVDGVFVDWLKSLKDRMEGKED